MVLKSNKRVHEDGVAHQPTKCYKPSVWQLSADDMQTQSNKDSISFGDRKCEHLKLEHEFDSVADESVRLSGITHIPGLDSCNDVVCTPGEDNDNGNVHGVSKHEDMDSTVEVDLMSATVQTENSVQCSKIRDNDASRKSDLTDGSWMQSFSVSKNKAYVDLQPHFQHVADTMLNSASSGGSVSFGDECLMQDEDLVKRHHEKEMEICTDISSTENVRKVPWSENLNAAQADFESTWDPFAQGAGFYPKEFACSSEFYGSFPYSPCLYVEPRKKVPVGPDFQVEIPDFNPDECDNEKYNRFCSVGNPMNIDKIGEQKPIVCDCDDPNSLRCTKMHIEAAREQIKLELGETFYSWKFDDMGESVSEKWTQDDQRTFHDVVSMHPPSTGRNFWNYLPPALPYKSMMDLVSYYFNVFILSRRALQNRLDPENVDSDDDDTEWQVSERPIGDDDSSLAGTDTTEGDYGNDEFDESDEGTNDSMDGGQDIVADSSMLKRQDSYDGAVVSYQENEPSDSKDNEHSCLDKICHNNSIDVHQSTFESDSGIMSNQDCDNYSSQVLCKADGYGKLEVGNNKSTTHGDDLCKADENVNDVPHGETAQTFCSHKEDCRIDGSYSLLESCDSKLWDMALSSSIKSDNDRLVSTCSMIKELFGDEGRLNAP